MRPKNRPHRILNPILERQTLKPYLLQFLADIKNTGVSAPGASKGTRLQLIRLYVELFNKLYVGTG